MINHAVVMDAIQGLTQDHRVKSPKSFDGVSIKERILRLHPGIKDSRKADGKGSLDDSIYYQVNKLANELVKMGNLKRIGRGRWRFLKPLLVIRTAEDVLKDFRGVGGLSVENKMLAMCARIAELESETYDILR